MKKFIVFLLLIAAIGGGYYWYGQNQEPPIDFRLDELLAPPVSADYYEDSNTLTVNRGSATVKRITGEIEEITSVTTVEMGDTITVGEESLVTIQWFDDSISRLQAGTELVIDEATFNPENITETDINLNVIKGEIWSKVKSLVDEDSEFLTYSGQVVAGVRGSTINFKVTDEGIIIESIEHAAMIGKRDPETKVITPNTYIIQGKRAKVVSEKEVEVDDIPKERLEQEWFKNNKADDKKASEKLIQKNLERLQKRAGLLPGEKGYKRKMRMIQKRMEEIDNPEARAEMEVRFIQMQLNESLAVLLNTPGANTKKIGINLRLIKSAIESGNLPKDTKQQLKNQAQTEFKALMRSMEGILPYEKLSQLNDIMRSNQMGMEEDDTRKDRILKKQLESRLYELMDAIEKGEINPKRINAFLKNYQKKLEKIGEDLERWDDLKSIALQFLKELEKMEGVELDADKMEDFKRMLGGKPEQKPVVRTKPAPQPSAEDPKVIKEEAPFHQGPSDV